MMVAFVGELHGVRTSVTMDNEFYLLCAGLLTPQMGDRRSPWKFGVSALALRDPWFG